MRSLERLRCRWSTAAANAPGQLWREPLQVWPPSVWIDRTKMLSQPLALPTQSKPGDAYRHSAPVTFAVKLWGRSINMRMLRKQVACPSGAAPLACGPKSATSPNSAALRLPLSSGVRLCCAVPLPHTLSGHSSVTPLQATSLEQALQEYALDGCLCVPPPASSLRTPLAAKPRTPPAPLAAAVSAPSMSSASAALSASDSEPLAESSAVDAKAKADGDAEGGHVEENAEEAVSLAARQWQWLQLQQGALLRGLAACRRLLSFHAKCGHCVAVDALPFPSFPSFVSKRRSRGARGRAAREQRAKTPRA